MRVSSKIAVIGISALIGLQLAAQESSPTLENQPKKLNEQVAQLIKEGKYSEALPLALKALGLREKSLGPEHPDIAESLNNLALLYQQMTDYNKAEPLYQRALKITEKVLGPEHPDTATSLNNLAGLYSAMGQFAKAEPLYQRAVQIFEKALGPEDSHTAASLNDLAELYRITGEYAKAEPLYRRSLGIREKTLGAEHADTGESLNNLAELYRATGEYTKAETLLQRALKIFEKALGPEHPTTATCLNNLATLYSQMGEYAKAEPLLQRSLQIREKALGPDHPDTGASLENLAQLYREMGDYSKAEPLLQRSLKISEKALGPEHPDTAVTLSSLAKLYYVMADYSKAAALFERSLKIREEVLGPEHPLTASSLNDLAAVYYQARDYSKAEPLFQRALKISEKTAGPEHPATAANLNNLAALYWQSGDYAKSAPLYQRALKITENAFGPEHPATATALNNLAFLLADKGDLGEALRLARRTEQADEKTLANILSFTSEEQRLAFQRTSDPYRLFASLGSAPELAQMVLRRKGLVLDSLLEDRLVAQGSKDPKLNAVLTELRSAKQQLMELKLETPTDFSEEAARKREALKTQLSNRVEELEGTLARNVAGLGRTRRALTVTLPMVQAALGKSDALIELLYYRHYLGKNKFEPHYGAVAIASTGDPKWIPLGPASELEKNIRLYQKSVRGNTDEPTLTKVLHLLHTQLWSPIESALGPGTKTVIVSPDAELSFVSFATLMASDDKFVSEKYSIRYVASGRDLLREFKASNSKETIVYANPDFGSKSTAVDRSRALDFSLRSDEMRDLQNISLPPLPGTAAEATALEKRGAKLTKVFLGSNATEGELRKVDAPRVLHLATHGFFLPESQMVSSKTASADPTSKLVNPMHRSGLALSGAQTTLQAWARGEVPPTENDGIVTAEEVGGLKLDTTELVVLSACETGAGEARAGEGVMGLRRGFVQAGTRNLLMTLWPISDQTTVNIMLEFYEATDRTHNAAQALSDTQRDWLVKLRKEKGLLAAVRLAGPFIMSSQGKP